MRNRLIRLPRAYKRLILALSDFCLIEFSLLACFYLRLGWAPVDILTFYGPVFAVTPVCVLFFLHQLGLYSSVTRHAGVEVMSVLARGISFGVLFVLLLFYLIQIKPALPRSVLLAFWVLSIFALFSSRLIAGRWLHGTPVSSLAMSFAGWKSKKRLRGIPVLVYGAGEAGRQLAGALNQGLQFDTVGFLDDSPFLHGEVVSGLKVHSPDELRDLVETYPSLEVFLAMPSASRHRRQEIIRFLEPFDLRVRSVPSMEELASGLVKVDAIREVEIADILGRESVPPDEYLLNQSIRGRRILVTGAGGSIGSELCRQIVKYHPTQVVLLDHSEYNLYHLFSELEESVARTGSSAELVPVIGTILDGEFISRLMKRHRIETVYHAAAYKHVPLVETNAYQGFRNNVIGTLQVATAAIKAQVEQFVLVSTDKAVRPTNLMGATKRLAELLLQAFSMESSIAAVEENGKAGNKRIPNNTRFTMVRFGNVLDSSGSVIPKFRKQIRKGGPVTVTHRDVTRFFMTIPEAAELVLQANALSEGGDLFVLDMGAPVKIDDLARELIQLSGLSIRDDVNPEGDIEIVYTGIRPGEKLHEELLIDDNVEQTRHSKIWRANERIIPWAELKDLLGEIDTCFRGGDETRLMGILSRDEIGYQPASISGIGSRRGPDTEIRRISREKR